MNLVSCFIAGWLGALSFRYVSHVMRKRRETVLVLDTGDRSGEIRLSGAGAPAMVEQLVTQGWEVRR